MGENKMNKFLVIFGGILICAFLFWLFFITSINAGHRGVVTLFGKVEPEILLEGIHVLSPLKSVHVIDVRVHKSSAETTGASKDLQKIATKFAINWYIDPTKVNYLYQTIGDEDSVEEKVLQPAVSEIVKAEMSKMTAEEVITRRLELKQNIDKALIKRLENYATIVTDVSLIDMAFTDQFSEAVEAKQIAEQKSQQATYEAVMAQRHADAEINRARGQAEAQKLLQQTLTPELIRLKAMEKWDGHLPQFIGNGPIPFINLEAGK